MEFSEKIKEIRNTFGLTQEALAEKLNVSRQAVAKWEMGKGLPDIENLKVMSKLFAVSIDTLIDNKADIPLTVLHEEIDIKNYGKNTTEQHQNLINKHFDDTWKIYILAFDNRFGSAEYIADFLSLGISSFGNIVSSIKTQHYLAVKGNYKLFISISKKTFDIKALSSDTDIKKFNIDNRTYMNIVEIKRD